MAKKIYVNLVWLFIFGFTGCATSSVTFTPDLTQVYQVADIATQAAIEKVDVLDRLLADGRREVICVLKNRTQTPVTIQVTCTFEDAEGHPLLEPSTTQTTKLSDSIPLSVRFESQSREAKRYSIQVKLTS
jgi:uncharacterized protein YcfL